MTKIITNKNIEVDIKYCEIENFCINEIMNNNEYLKEFMEFKKNYNYFNAYFDFIFHTKKYKLCEPLLIKGTYLFNNDNYYYIIKDNKEINKGYYDFTLMSDFYISIVTNPYEIQEGFFILNDGTLLTTNYVERHLKSAKVILNNYLIKHSYVYKKYLRFIEDKGINFEYYIIDFLIENLGIIYGKKYGINVDLISNKYTITQTQLNTIKKLLKYYNVKNEDYNNFNNKMFYKNR